MKMLALVMSLNLVMPLDGQMPQAQTLFKQNALASESCFALKPMRATFTKKEVVFLTLATEFLVVPPFRNFTLQALMNLLYDQVPTVTKGDGVMFILVATSLVVSLIVFHHYDRLRPSNRRIRMNIDA